MFVDTHAHLFWDSFQDDFNQVIQRAHENGVEAVINVGVDVALSRAASLLELDQIKVYSSVAIHPEEAIKYWKNENQIQKDIDQLENIYLSNPQKIIAVGECGLDFAYFKREGYLPNALKPELAKHLQRQLFESHIKLAKKLNLPLLLHVRDDRSENPELIECWDEIFEMTNNHFGVLHCYSGLEKTTKRAMASNFLVSFAGNLTYPKNEYLQKAVKMLPLEKILLETDCPFSPPQSIRGRRNEPSSVKEIAQFIAALKGVSLQEVAAQTTSNFYKLFRLSKNR